LFDLIGAEVVGADVLDLFAGLGTVGVEALSRGARSAVFVEREPELCELLRVNLGRLGCLERSEVLCRDVVDALRGLEGHDRAFAIAFVDPPYGAGQATETISTLAAGGLLTPGAIVVAEHGRREQPPTESRLVHLWRRELGYTVLSGYRYDLPPRSQRSAEHPTANARSSAPNGGSGGADWKLDVGR
jgi:16S rRNA (guanine(966)-N(2))-methyltransferase RsmD